MSAKLTNRDNYVSFGNEQSILLFPCLKAIFALISSHMISVKKYFTLAERNPNIHKQWSLRRDFVAHKDHWQQFIFPGCFPHYLHPFAKEIAEARSSRVTLRYLKSLQINI